MADERPMVTEMPRVWASAALVTPMDDDIYDCAAGHTTEDGLSAACTTCTDEKSEALEATSLVYNMVLATYQAGQPPYVMGNHFNGTKVYKLVRCGSREAAAAEAFYSASVNGWNVVFACVTRADDALEGFEGKIKRVEDLWMLGEDDEEDDYTRVFF